MRRIALTCILIALLSCSNRKSEEFVGDSLVPSSAMRSGEQPAVESVTEEPDTLDIQDTAIVVYEPPARQQEKLLAKDQEYVEYLSDFENYTFPLTTLCRDKISLYYTSARFLRIYSSHGVRLLDTKNGIHRKVGEDAGVIFLKGTAQPMVIRDVTDDYSADIQKFFGISVRADSTQ